MLSTKQQQQQVRSDHIERKAAKQQVKQVSSTSSLHWPAHVWPDSHHSRVSSHQPRPVHTRPHLSVHATTRARMQSHFSIDAATAIISFTLFQVQLQKTQEDHSEQLQQQRSQFQQLQQQWEELKPRVDRLEQLEQQRQQTEKQTEKQNAQRYAEQQAFKQLCAQQQEETEKERYEQKVRLIHSNLTQTTVTFTLSILK